MRNGRGPPRAESERAARVPRAGCDRRGGWLSVKRWPGLWIDSRGGPPPGGLAQPMPGGDGSCVIIWDLDVGSGPASAGQIYGRQWNNTEVLPQQYAPKYGNF